MTLSKYVQQVLNGTVQSISTVLPLETEISAPSMIENSFKQKEISVLIGLVGDLKSRIIIDTSLDKVSEIGELMFGMPIEGEMLESFCGEMGNMIAGNLCTTLEQEGLKLDISPPTVMVGTAKITGFKKAFQLPVVFEDETEMKVLLTIDDSKA